jgi:UDP:flavonoid glycosyltransferase YjiC (YdhE family)
MIKPNVLFLPASIRSHVVPALYLSNLIKQDFRSTFAVTDVSMKQLVEGNGANAIVADSYRIHMGMEANYLRSLNKKVSLISLFAALLKRSVFEHRRKELKDLITRLTPQIIFIDIFNSTDLLAVHADFPNIKIAFFNPMLSTYRVKGIPAINERYWGIPNPLHDQKADLRNMASSLLKWLDTWQFEAIISDIGLNKKYPIANNRTHAILFQNAPEFVLAPLELELFEKVQMQTQTYLGLCINEDRVELEIKPEFVELLNLLDEKKRVGDRIIYCSFGTYYDGNLKPFLVFLHRLLDAINGISKVHVVISVNKLVLETLVYQRQIPPNVQLFTFVPQLEVLKMCCLHISHGGMGSIKESILYAVPMLIVPLEPKWDNNGNCLKIEHHELGLGSSLTDERSEVLRNKILQLLDEPKYRSNVRAFRERTLLANSPEASQRKIQSVLKRLTELDLPADLLPDEIQFTRS